MWETDEALPGRGGEPCQGFDAGGEDGFGLSTLSRCAESRAHGPGAYKQLVKLSVPTRVV